MLEHFLQPGRGVARPAVDGVCQNLAALRFLLEAEVHQRLLLGHQLLVAEDRWHEGQCVPASRMLDDLRSETAVRPSQQHVEDHAQERGISSRQSLAELRCQRGRQALIGRSLIRRHRHVDELLLVVGQYVATDILELQEHGERQYEAVDALRAEAGSLHRAYRELLAPGCLVRVTIAFGVDVLEHAVVAHERHGCWSHAATRVGPVAVLDHALGEDAEQEVEQVVGVAAHERSGQQHGFPCLGCENAHGLALGRTAVLVLMPLIHHQQIEVAVGKLSFYELGRLVAAFAEAELDVRHRSLHAFGLPIAEDEVALGVHQVDELRDVVHQHRGQEVLAEVVQQALRPDRADGWNPTHRLEDRCAPVAAVRLAWPDQRPERPTTGGTGTSTVTTLELLHRDQVAFQVLEDLAAIRARSEQLAAGGALLPAGEPPMETHPHPHAAEDEELLASVVGVAHLIS
ncbi:Uncharacterised protein [Acinetobacter baumannii]|nr:Uncharacterised protein [Acinetobacter baumannii]